MTSELLSTARPSPLRLAGFLALVLGAALVGAGATQQWAAIGFVGDVDGAADVPVHGTDLWEGKLVLLAAAVALVLMLVIRLARSSTARRVLAIAVIVIGLVSAAIAAYTVMTARDRFAGTEGIDRMAEEIARITGDAEDVVREALLETLLGDLRVDVGTGPWLVVAGGIVLAVAGWLTLAWVRERERSTGAADEPGAPGDLA